MHSTDTVRSFSSTSRNNVRRIPHHIMMGISSNLDSHGMQSNQYLQSLPVFASPVSMLNHSVFSQSNDLVSANQYLYTEQGKNVDRFSVLSQSNSHVHVGLPDDFVIGDNVTLTLPDKALGDVGCKKLCELLKENTSVVTLELGGNGIGADGARALAELIRENRTIRSISLEWNALGTDEDALKMLAEAIEGNETIVHLDLRNNKISAVGGIYLAKAVEKNQTLQHLDLRWNIIRGSGKKFANALTHNAILTALFLSGNGINVDVLSEVDNLCTKNQKAQLHISDVELSDYTFSHFEKQAEKRLLIASAEKASLSHQLENASERQLTLAEQLENEKQNVQIASKHLKLAVDAKESLQQTLEVLLNEKRTLLLLHEKDAALLQKIEEERDALVSDRNRTERRIMKELERFACNLLVETNHNNTLESKLSQLLEKSDQIFKLKEEKERALVAEVDFWKKKCESDIDSAEKSLTVKLDAATNCYVQQIETLKDRVESLDKLNQIAGEGRKQAEQELAALKQKQLSLKLEFEQNYADFESKIRQEWNVKLESESKRFEDNIRQIQGLRDESKHRAERLEADYNTLLSKCQQEMEQLQKWLEEERSSRAASDDELRSLKVRIMTLESDHRSLKHAADMKQVEIQHLENLLNNLRESYQQEQEEQFKTRAAELVRYDEKLRVRDDEFNKMHSRMREAVNRAAQFKEELERREEAWKLSINGMRQAVVESVADSYYSNDFEDLQRTESFSNLQNNSNSGASRMQKSSSRANLNSSAKFIDSRAFLKQYSSKAKSNRILFFFIVFKYRKKSEHQIAPKSYLFPKKSIAKR